MFKLKSAAILRTNVIVICVSSMLLLSQGCTEDRSELEKKILTNDPSFQETIDKRNALQQELDSHKVKFLQKKQEVDTRIIALKEEQKQLEKEYSSFAEKTRRQLYPEKNALEEKLADTILQYNGKKVEIRGTDRDIREINALIKKKDSLSMTQQEMKTWNDRLLSLMKKRETYNSEKNKLQEDIKITKLKIKVLK